MLVCKQDKCCPELTKNGKRLCPFCRFQKCLKIGMEPDLVVGLSCIKSSVRKNQMLVSLAQKKMSTLKLHDGDCRERISFLISPMYSIGLSKQLVWLKKPDSSSLKYHVVDLANIPGEKYQIAFKLDNEAIHELCNELSVYNSQTSLLTENHDEVLVYHRDSQSVVSCSSKFETMEIMTDDHRLRLRDVDKFSKYYDNLHWLDYSTAAFPDTLDPVHILTVSGEKCCSNITTIIESLDFFRSLSLEDQIIVLKESFEPIMFLVSVHTYDKESECFMLPAFKGLLTLCMNSCSYKNLTVEYGREMHDFQSNFMDNFYDFLRKDIFVIGILCILCVLEDRPGLSCQYFFNTERKLFIELLDCYIKAKLSSEEWSHDWFSIWKNIDFAMKEVPRFGPFRQQLIKRHNDLTIGS